MRGGKGGKGGGARRESGGKGGKGGKGGSVRSSAGGRGGKGGGRIADRRPSRELKSKWVLDAGSEGKYEENVEPNVDEGKRGEAREGGQAGGSGGSGSSGGGRRRRKATGVTRAKVWTPDVENGKRCGVLYVVLMVSLCACP